MIDELIETIKRETSSTDTYDTHKFASLFEQLAKSLDGKVDVNQLNAFKTIGAVCNFSFNSKERQPFGPMFVLQGKRSMIPDDLTADQLDQLATISDQDLPPALIARLCDVLWVRNKDHARTRRAITAYLECAEKGIDEHWPNAAESARRAAKIANELGRNAPERKIVKEKLLALFESAAKEPSKDEKRHWPRSVAEILIEECENVDYEGIADKCLVLGKLMTDVWTKEGYFQLAADAFNKSGNSKKRKNALHLLGESWEKDAEKFRSADGGDGMQIAYRMEHAMQAYRLAGDKDKSEESLKGLQLANKLSIDQMKSIRVDVDMSKFLNEVEKKMDGKTGVQAIEVYIQLHRPLSYAVTYQAAKKEAQTPSIRKLFASASLVEEGNIASRTTGGFEANEQDILLELVNRYTLNQSVADVLLERARTIILKDNTKAWAEAITELVSKSEFVPDNRREIFTRAMVSGFSGDLLVFTHLIIPQIENSVRRFIGQADGKTTTHRDGFMKERDLNQLLTERDSGKDAYSVFGENVTWEMRALLIEQSGPNLRNRICHGLTSMNECEGQSPRFLIWLVLFLVKSFNTKSQKPEDSTNK